VITEHDPAQSHRHYNQQRVLDALRRSGVATRAELARHTGLSRATVSAAVDRLIAEGLAQEAASADRRAMGPGRPATALRATAPQGVVVGLDFGHSHLRAAVADLAGTVLAERHRSLPVDNSPDDAIRTAAAELRQLLDRIGERPDAVSTVVMGLPSPIDRGSGRVVTNNILPGWVDRAPARELHELIRLPVLLDNDANLAAIGEMTYGAGRGARDLIYVKASTGIGTGLIFDGRIYRGATGTAGELGHVQIQPDGAACRCGSRGCLETLVSVPHVLDILQPVHPERLTIEHVIDLVGRGDASARRVVTDAGRAIGRSLADLCNVLNPSALVIGGELAAAGSALNAGIREAIDRYTQAVIAHAVTISTGALGERAEVLGAIALAVQTGTPALSSAGSTPAS
jgi:predicted NBD/HSP70 family sugar kinase